MGRAFRVLKRTAHLTVHVAEHPEKVVAVAAAAPAGQPKRRAGKVAASKGAGERRTKDSGQKAKA
jgi:hypothetical protein